VVELLAAVVELAALLGVDLVLVVLLVALLFALVSGSDSDSDSELVSSSLLELDSAFFLSAEPLVVLAVLCCGRKRLTKGFFSGTAVVSLAVEYLDELGALAFWLVELLLDVAGAAAVADVDVAATAAAAAELAELSVDALLSLLPDLWVFLTAATWAETGGFDCWIVGVGVASESVALAV